MGNCYYCNCMLLDSTCGMSSKGSLPDMKHFTFQSNSEGKHNSLPSCGIQKLTWLWERAGLSLQFCSILYWFTMSYKTSFASAWTAPFWVLASSYRNSSLQTRTCCVCQWSRFFARFRTECMLLLYNFLSASCRYLVVYLLSTLWSFVLTISAQNNWTVFPPQNFCSWLSYSVY